MPYIEIEDYLVLQEPFNARNLQTGEMEEVSDYREFDGPTVWAEIRPNGMHVACAITWDDMWLVKREVERMMELVSELEEAKNQGLRWQDMKIEWRDDIEHFALTIPFYRLPDGENNLSYRDVE